MSLEELLKVEVVSVASRFPQEVREAPASITVITGQDSGGTARGRWPIC
ncbi:MAG: hypothetical protein ACRD1U_02970 [Vicinamibacterales bacterium]